MIVFRIITYVIIRYRL